MSTNKTHKKFWYNPWTVAIGSLIIGSLLLNWLTDWGKVLIEYCARLFLSLVDIITITIPIPIWGVLIILFVFWLLVKDRFNTYIQKEAQNITIPSFYKYRSDVFEDVLYKWNYERDYEGKFSVIDITPFCPKDNCQLSRWNDCAICFRSFNIKDEGEVRILIRHKIDNKLFLN